MYESTIIGLVGPPYPYCSLAAFCAFAWLRLGTFGAFGAFSAFGACKIFSSKINNKKFKTALTTSFTLLVLSLAFTLLFQKAQSFDFTIEILDI